PRDNRQIHKSRWKEPSSSRSDASGFQAARYLGLQARSLETARRREVREKPWQPPVMGHRAAQGRNKHSAGTVRNGSNSDSAGRQLSEIKLRYWGESCPT